MPQKLTLLQLNDTHSYLELHNELFYEKRNLAFRKAGGYTRIQKLFIGGEEVIPDKEYTASYVTNQGVPKKFGKNHQNLEKHAVEAMMDYLAATGSYEKGLRGTYQIV